MAYKRGAVKTLKPGYGFLKFDDGSEDAFFLPTAMKESKVRFDDLVIGQVIEAEVERGEKGWRASSVRVLL